MVNSDLIVVDSGYIVVSGLNSDYMQGGASSR